MLRVLGLLVIFLPLLGALGGGCFQKVLGRQTSARLPVGVMALSFCAFVVFLGLFLETPVPFTLRLFYWFNIKGFSAPFILSFDFLSIIMIGVVTLISLFVHIYSLAYMAEDPGKPRFMALLNLFTFMMLFFVTAGTTLQLFAGWEGISLCSYLLIGFWSHKEGPTRGALKALLINRLGDVFLLLSLGGLFCLYGSVSISTITAMAAESPINAAGFFASLVGWCLLGAALVKSAQIGFHPWLIGAMEGPTPVSALIHAATLVTAGVFLLLRFETFLERVPIVLTAAVFIGSVTAIFGGLMALGQRNIKHLIAYSTCSQLGYMILGVGLRTYGASFFHLVTHAFFKSLLFLGAGALIYGVYGKQDIEEMAVQQGWPPFLYGSMAVGLLSLTGIPFFAGFFSKDLIIESAWHVGTPIAYFGFASALFGSFLTGLYSIRLMVKIFHSKTPFNLPLQPFTILWSVPLVLLSVCALLVGYLGKTPVGEWFYWPDPLKMGTNFSFLVSSSGFIGIILGGLLYSSVLFQKKLRCITSKALSPFLTLGSLDLPYNCWVPSSFSWIAYKSRSADEALNIWGPLGIGRGVVFLHQWMRRLQTGYIYHYMIVMLGGLMTILLFLNYGDQ